MQGPKQVMETGFFQMPGVPAPLPVCYIDIF